MDPFSEGLRCGVREFDSMWLERAKKHFKRLERISDLGKSVEKMKESSI